MNFGLDSARWTNKGECTDGSLVTDWLMRRGRLLWRVHQYRAGRAG